MKHIVLDLEMNNIRRESEAREICTMETIEIGAVMLDDNLQEIASFRTYVKPEYNDRIEKKIKKLTGITDEMVQCAPKFNDAFKMFTSWCLGTNDEVTIYAWSENDYNQVIKEIEIKGCQLSGKEQQLIAKEWTDFQNEFDGKMGFDRCLSLKNALDMAGLDFSGREHDALDDARNTAELLQIFRNETLFEKTLRKIEEAMKPSSLGNTLGSMFDLAGLAVR